MTKGSNAKKDKKISKRKTPRDIENERLGVYVETKHKSPPRKPTKAEQHANNISLVKYTAKMVRSLKQLKPVFEKELAQMNKGKVGRPYQFSNSEIMWIMGVMTTLSITFRVTAGFVGAILELADIEPPSYSRLFERAKQLNDELIGNIKNSNGVFIVVGCDNVIDDEREVGLDSSGINLSDTTLWRSKKWGTKPVDRGWLKLHALSDVNTNEIIAYAITTESVGDAPLLKTLLQEAMSKGHKISTVYADGAYSSVENFQFVCKENKMKFITSFRSNTQPKNIGSSDRGEAARLWCELPYDEWVVLTGYGKRWKCEVVFSDFKRLFPKTVTAHSIDGAIRQVFNRIGIFNEYKALRSKIIEEYGCTV